MKPFLRVNKKEMTMNSRKENNSFRKRRLKEVAHRLNRKGHHPVKLSHPRKTADSFEDTDAIEISDNNEN